MTPPKVVGAPRPTSSLVMSSTFAPFGGTTRGGHHAFYATVVEPVLSSEPPKSLVKCLGTPYAMRVSGFPKGWFLSCILFRQSQW